MNGAELTKANKAGLMLMCIAIGIVGGMQNGNIGLEAGLTTGIICAVLALMLLWQ